MFNKEGKQFQNQLSEQNADSLVHTGVKITIMMLPITSISAFHPVNHQFVSLRNNASHVFHTQNNRMLG